MALDMDDHSDSPPAKKLKTTKTALERAKEKRGSVSMQEILRERQEREANAKKLKFVPRAVREARKKEQEAEEAIKEAQRKKEADDKFEAWKASAYLPKPEPVKEPNRYHEDDDMNEKIRQQVHLQYYGPEKKSTFTAHKKRKHASEKKFSFDWSLDDDTTGDYKPPVAVRDRRFMTSDEILEEDLQKAERIYKIDLDHDVDGAKERYDKLIERAHSDRAYRDRGLKTFRHWSTKTLDEMTTRDWRLAMSEYHMTVKGGNVPKPARNWDETGLPANLLKTVNKLGYSDPSEIQRIAIPASLQGRDVIGIAETGSGKTAAFALPLLVYISKLPRLNYDNPGPYSVILVPTRELAQQIEGEFKKLAAGTGARIVSIVGGHSVEGQAYHMRDGAEVIVATPGRLKDLLERRMLTLNSCCYVILDEADRMIDMGFKDDLDKILALLPSANEKPDSEMAEDSKAMNTEISSTSRFRQTHLYSATFSSSALKHIAQGFTRRPVEIQIGESNSAVNTVTQIIEWRVGEDNRKRRLDELLRDQVQYPPPVIVFVNNKSGVDMLQKDIRKMGHQSAALHGGKTQDQREAALESVRQGKADVLVATDLAGRGIDVANVSLVINFEMPLKIEPYLHRIGRTGRAGKTGKAITFISPSDADIFYDLKGVLQRADARMPEEMRKHPATQQKQAFNPKSTSKADEQKPFMGP